MNPGTALFGGFGLGAGLMYFCDPDRGRRRRALVRDQMIHAIHEIQCGTQTAWRDLSQRAQGAGYEAGKMFKSDHPSDAVITERVRSKLGRNVSHPAAIQVTVRNGRAMLTGPILADEVDNVIRAVSSVRGVTDVVNHLDVHQEAGDVSALQGGCRRSGEQSSFLSSNWPPGIRLLVGSIGGALAAYGCTQRFPTACVLGTIGLGLVARAASNFDPTEFLPTSESSTQKARAMSEANV